MDAVAELRVLLASGQSLITVTTTEEQRLLAIAARRRQRGPAVDVVGRERSASGRCATRVRIRRRDQVLDNLATLSGPWTVVLCDPGPLLADADRRSATSRSSRSAPYPGQTILLVGPQLTIPPELDGLARAWSLPPPSTAELGAAVERVERRVQRQGLRSELTDGDRLRLARARSPA